MSDTVVDTVVAPAEDPILKEISELKALVKEASAVSAKSLEAPSIRKGENVMSSRPFSYGRMMLAVVRKQAGDLDFGSQSKVELELAGRLRKESDTMCGQGGSGYSQFCAPVASAFMPISWNDVDGTKENGDPLDLPGYTKSLVKEIRDHFVSSPDYDPQEAQRLGVRKDAMVRNDATFGGTLVPLAAQGELIEVLRNSMAIARTPGVRMVPLPPQGSIRYPRQTSLTSISGYTEGATISGSRFGTGAVTLTAKRYSGLVDVTDELLRFAGNTSVEALIRQDLAEQTARVTDKDMIEGPGGTQMLGLINIPSIQTKTAGTVGANGNTMWPEDILNLIAQQAGANAPTERGVAILMRPELWALISASRNSQAAYMFQSAFANGAFGPGLWGHSVIQSTNISNTRRKGSSAALTMVLSLVPSEILIGQSGVIDFAMTDSDSSKFAQGIKTVRVMSYLDVGVRHESSVGLLDQVLDVRTGV